MRLAGYEFREVTAVDFEFIAPPGERPRPVCMVARELSSGRVHRMWQEELNACHEAPYPTDTRALVLAFYASAEVGCHLVLGWRPPANVLDLYVEFRRHANGLVPPCGWGLIGALTYFGLDALTAIEKEGMRQLVLRGGPWTMEEKQALLAYCEEDVLALQRLLPAMEGSLDLPRALHRGRYMVAAAHIEHQGIPIDVSALALLREHWTSIQDDLIAEVDKAYGIYDGRSFRQERFERYLTAHGIPWPRTDGGQLALDDDTFRQMARSQPALAPLRELRYALSQMRLADLAVGSDGRNRVLLSAFSSRTGRNQPSNSKFIFGPAVWLRGLIRPQPGRAIAYIDWSQQEFGIAAALSGDEKMMEAYTCGDPYLRYGQQAGVIPPNGTKQTHKAEREQFKQAVLAVQYGMGHEALAIKLGVSPAHARELLESHRRTYPRFWAWSDAAEVFAMLHGHLYTVFGWQVLVGANVNTRSLRNFPAQANGAEMLRLACCYAVERGINVIAPVHDALLVEGSEGEIDEVVTRTQGAMADASRMVLSGFELRSDAKVVRHPSRYMDERGERMWNTVWELLQHQVSHAQQEVST
ncbi:MAG TPA: DNA polymerase [Archangium sp.]|nr:DNA polymerase [Archangium sp.]